MLKKSATEHNVLNRPPHLNRAEALLRSIPEAKASERRELKEQLPPRGIVARSVYDRPKGCLHFPRMPIDSEAHMFSRELFTPNPARCLYHKLQGGRRTE